MGRQECYLEIIERRHLKRTPSGQYGENSGDSARFSFTDLVEGKFMLTFFGPLRRSVHCFLVRVVLDHFNPPLAVETRLVHLRQLTHSLDPQAALQRRLEFHRTRLLARDIALVASSPYFLQGTSEKIYLNRPVGQWPLELADFFT